MKKIEKDVNCSVGYDYWSDDKNRKNFFIQFAKTHGFDPLVPQNWYTIKSDLIKYSKDGSSVLEHYAGNTKDALQALFPDIGLDIKFLKGSATKKNQKA